MLLLEFTRTTTFRWTLVIFGAFAISILVMFAFIYWQTAAYMNASVDRLIIDHADTVAVDVPQHRLEAISDYLREDPRRVKLGALFSPEGDRVGGNIESLPPGLRPDAGAQNISMVRPDALGSERQKVRAVARRLADGQTIVIGRDVDELVQIAKIVERALALGLVPALFLGLTTGAMLSARAQKRVEQTNQRVQRIVAGELRERLPTRGVDDPFDRWP